MPYPAPLQEIIDLCEDLSESERRELLWSYAESAVGYEPQPDEVYAVKDERHDKECLDVVGIYLAMTPSGTAQFRIRMGPKVQTLTRAMANILCKGFNDQPLEVLMDCDNHFIRRIVGEELMRLRSRTVYYVLDRMREAAASYPSPSSPRT